ncbi:MAG: hypothetical protein LBL62_01315 [Planctomycetaceae bacterium]|jgi:hypothetical protein|nr:hypothetical protein [Planctomycetaceae bacterium]
MTNTTITTYHFKKTSLNRLNTYIYTVLPILVLFIGAFFFTVFGEEPPEENGINAEFTKMLLNMDDYSWDALGDETVPLEQQNEEVLELLYHLVRVVPSGFLKQNAVKPFPNFSVLVHDPAQFRGQAFELKGHVVLVREIPLNPAERKRFRIPTIFRCRFCVDEEHFADILTAFVPAAWKRNEPIKERSTVTGIYIKRLALNEPISEKLPFNESIFNESTFKESDFVPFLVAPRFQWFPDTFLGNFGFDVGSFDQVPPLRITDLKKKQFEVVPSLRILGRNEIIHRAFKFTEADREPFYGLLQAVSQIPPNRIRQEARRILEKEGKHKNSVTELFNNPAGTRGKPVLLHGVAKQVLLTLVEDKEVEILFGVKKYYQIYFYTNDSQGNPLVICVPSLPEGMPVGASPDYAEKITIAAIPYKLWVYETSAKLEGGNGYKPNYAPLLIGKSPVWHPKKQSAKPPVNTKTQNTKTTISLTLFVLLLLTWTIIKRFQNKKIIDFKLR